MSSSTEIEFLCPFCKARNRTTVWTRVDAGEHPELVEPIIDSSLFESVCRGCGESVPADYGMDFHDPDRRLFIRYEASGGIQTPPAWADSVAAPPDGYSLRRVRSQADLIELVRIWVDSLDDVRMLALKHLLVARIERDAGAPPLVCSYDRITEDGEDAVLEYVVIQTKQSEPEFASVPWSMYQDLQNQADSVRESLFPTGRMVDWDAVAARRMLESVKNHP